MDAERVYWACESGKPSRLFGTEAPSSRVEAVRCVDMTGLNSVRSGGVRQSRPEWLTGKSERSTAAMCLLKQPYSLQRQKRTAIAPRRSGKANRKIKSLADQDHYGLPEKWRFP